MKGGGPNGYQSHDPESKGGCHGQPDKAASLGLPYDCESLI